MHGEQKLHGILVAGRLKRARTHSLFKVFSYCDKPQVPELNCLA